MHSTAQTTRLIKLRKSDTRADTLEAKASTFQNVCNMSWLQLEIFSTVTLLQQVQTSANWLNQDTVGPTSKARVKLPETPLTRAVILVLKSVCREYKYSTCILSAIYSLHHQALFLQLKYHFHDYEASRIFSMNVQQSLNK